MPPHVHMQGEGGGGGGEGEGGDGEGSQAGSSAASKPHAGLNLRNCEIVTTAEIKSR